MKAFGWKAAHLDNVATPVGELCIRCKLVIKIDDSGVVMPHVSDTVTEQPWHLMCLYKALGILN